MNSLLLRRLPSVVSAQATVTAYADLESLQRHLPPRLVRWFSDQEGFASSSSFSSFQSSASSPSRVLTALDAAASAVRTAAAELAGEAEGEEDGAERQRERLGRHPLHVRTLQFASCSHVAFSVADEKKKKKPPDEGSRRLRVWTDSPYVLSIASLVSHHETEPVE